MSQQTLHSRIDWDKNAGLVPAIVQDAGSGDVLMLGYMNADALAQTQASGMVTFYSRSKQRLWQKGESSGHVLELVSIDLDCDQDTLLVKARPQGPTCHTGNDTCFGEKQGFSKAADINLLLELESLIKSRKQQPATGGYTSSLFDAGINRIAQKVGEEGVETVIAALAEDDVAFISEASDLVYHLIVLLVEKGLSLSDVLQELKHRRH
ncbi:MAG: bifunctional phosphoribosyl-AMP cyclohydrolase/phosphoribosyl-ATP diphosphatase HisIE [Gammaproteobacteria bacterium]|nr:bifunctional phosphoribosyl-AMP cyclohydrolase/phosphoribosyl-ATP diphosphatase HisIE [Gammaproteobacteria bacterium]NNC97210.1 bifunctional phosphoribosyl-AMP cyclohydrolase/phosphoribosyl-ATP diphosphatase HisIE [Gammaproteobacteria bacterium]NNM14997.1 bifunctional phosphoribosyl-AMP cyclohydrolase/phosphoribosyl-ATP diphosphatase HisIE [Gammaproteobacteria bacterium]